METNTKLLAALRRVVELCDGCTDEATLATARVAKQSLSITEGCGHEDNEDCMNCAICGECSESLDENDICTECQKTGFKDKL